MKILRGVASCWRSNGEFRQHRRQWDFLQDHDSAAYHIDRFTEDYCPGCYRGSLEWKFSKASRYLESG